MSIQLSEKSPFRITGICVGTCPFFAAAVAVAERDGKQFGFQLRYEVTGRHLAAEYAADLDALKAISSEEEFCAELSRRMDAFGTAVPPHISIGASELNDKNSEEFTCINGLNISIDDKSFRSAGIESNEIALSDDGKDLTLK